MMEDKLSSPNIIVMAEYLVMRVPGKLSESLFTQPLSTIFFSATIFKSRDSKDPTPPALKKVLLMSQNEL